MAIGDRWRRKGKKKEKEGGAGGVCREILEGRIIFRGFNTGTIQLDCGQGQFAPWPKTIVMKVMIIIVGSFNNNLRFLEWFGLPK